MNCQDHLYRNQHPTRSPGAGFSNSAASAWERWRLLNLLADEDTALPQPPIRWLLRQPQFAPKAKSVIFLFMAGAPSHLELFDNKPQLAKFDGTLAPAGTAEGLSRRVHQSQLQAAGSQVQVRQVRTIRHRTFRVAAALGEDRGRHRDREVDGRRMRSTTRRDSC